MKIPKFIFPVTVSLVAFIWGYRGELWIGNAVNHQTDTTGQTSPTAPTVTSTLLSKDTSSSSGTFNVPSTASQLATPRPLLPNSGTTEARELPVMDESGEYAPEDDGEVGEEIGGSGGMDEADQADAEDVTVEEDEAGTAIEDSSEVADDAPDDALEADDIVPEEVQPSKPPVRVQK